VCNVHFLKDLGCICGISVGLIILNGFRVCIPHFKIYICEIKVSTVKQHFVDFFLFFLNHILQEVCFHNLYDVQLNLKLFYHVISW